MWEKKEPQSYSQGGLKKVEKVTVTEDQTKMDANNL